MRSLFCFKVLAMCWWSVIISLEVAATGSDKAIGERAMTFAELFTSLVIEHNITNVEAAKELAEQIQSDFRERGFDAQNVKEVADAWKEEERERIEQEQEAEHALAEHLEDLDARGFGGFLTDCPHAIARQEAQEQFDDRLAMFMNEY